MIRRPHGSGSITKTRRMKPLYKKIAATTLSFALFSPALTVFAQSSQQTNTNTNPPRAILINEQTGQPMQNVQIQNTQAYGALYGNRQQGSPSISASAAGSSLSTCLGASGVTNAAKQAISSTIGSLTSSISAEVPTAENVQRGKETGTLSTGYISWDSLGYCTVNALIESIGKATVNWINSGFQGNPVFVDNPEKFFSDIADIQAGQFLGEISNGFLCSPVKNVVKLNLANQYNKNISPYGQRGQCTFSGISGNLQQFTSGQSFNWNDWISYTQSSNNNPFGATFNAQMELDRRIAQSVGTQSQLLNWGRGFLSDVDPATGKITSPGSVIEGQINQRLFSGESRLQIADEFDEIVNALVNQLVKIAISEVTKQGN